ncbi:MAG: globin domain-containing protein [Pseudomonadota bacterium]
MSLDHHEIALVQHSLEKLRAALPPGDTRFYENLFRRAPELRAMFREDLAGQGMKFLTTLSVITDALTTPEMLGAEVTRLAEGHRAMGIEASSYAPMGDALFETFREVLGPAFTTETHEAWQTAYAMIAAQMIARGEAPLGSR